MKLAGAAKVGADDYVASGRGSDDIEALQREELAPVVARQGDAITLSYARHGIGLAFDALSEHSDGIHGELVVTSAIQGEVHWGKLNLASTSAREQLVKKLAAAVPKVPWREVLERACRSVALAVRAGAPIEPLLPVRADPTTRYLLAKLLVAGETNVIYADGGSGKSLLALLAAVALGLQIDLPGGLTPSRQASTLYLDWESCKEEHQDRLAAILRGFGDRQRPPIYYRPMQRALTDDMAFLRAEVQRLEIGHVIVDSLAPASGADPESTDAGVRTMNALRSLGPVTRLILAHVSKSAAEQQVGTSKPFGSVFIHNLARNVWELRRARDEDGEDLIVGLYNTKVNSGRRLPPFGLRLEFGESAIRLGGHDLGTQPDLMAHTSLVYRIQKALAAGARTVPDLVDETGGTKDTVTRTLRRLRGGGRVVALDEARWGLPARSA